MNIRKYLRSALLLLVALSLRAATLRTDTLAAWDNYTDSVISQMHERERPGGTFLWSFEDAARLARIQHGEIVVAPAPGPSPRKVPGGLIHHWIGAAFFPNISLDTVLDVTRDYDHYKEFYHPSVATSKTLSRSPSSDVFSMMLVNKAFLLRTALDGDYEVTGVRLDPHHFYSILKSTRLQEVENYEEADESRLPAGEGGGYIWRVLTLVRLVERDGGVYIEIEAVALSRDIPSAARLIIDPIVRRASHNSVLISLQQTEKAVEARYQAELKSPKPHKRMENSVRMASAR